MKKNIVVLISILAILLGGCASLSESEVEDRRLQRETRLVEAREAFGHKSRSCREQGGTISINCRFSSNMGITRCSAHDFEAAQCRSTGPRR